MQDPLSAGEGALRLRSLVVGPVHRRPAGAAGAPPRRVEAVLGIELDHRLARQGARVAPDAGRRRGRRAPGAGLARHLLAEQLDRDVGEELGGLGVPELRAGLPEPHAPAGQRQREPALRPGHADVAEPPLLVEAGGALGGRLVLRPGPLVRQGPVLQAGQEHRLELQPLGGVQRHERHAPLRRLGVGLAEERDLLQEAGQRRRARLVRVARRRLAGAAPRRTPGPRPPARPGSRPAPPPRRCRSASSRSSRPARSRSPPAPPRRRRGRRPRACSSATTAWKLGRGPGGPGP